MSIRHRRLLAVAAAAAALVCVAAVASSSGGTPDRAAQAPAVSSLFRGIQEHDGVLGDPKAPLTVTEYIDLQCPVCAAAARQTLPALVRDYVRTGKVRLEARTLHFIGPDSERAARFAAGAAQQNRFWPFLEAFYAAQGQENSGFVTDAFLRSVARPAGVDADSALAQMNSASAQAQLNRANADATTLGVDSTPTFTVARGNGRAHVLATGAQDPRALAAALDAELAR
jgi:protein-disulfide isomerase